MSVPAVPTIRGGIEVEIIDDDGNWVQKRYRAAELPTVLARDRDVFRAEPVIITQFCRDWRSWPEDREWMLEGEPDPDSDPYDLAKVAAIVRGLCERWDHPTPAWIEGVRAPTEILLFLDKVPLNRLFDAPMVVKSMMGRFGGCAASSGIGWRGGGCGLGRVRVLRCDWGGFRRLGRSG